MSKVPSRRKPVKKRLDIVDECRFVVIQFLQPPYASINDLVCVPESWIRIRKMTPKNCIVAFPDESPSITEIRIKTGDKPSDSWKLYAAAIKFETNSYENANEFIIKNQHNASSNINSTIISTNKNQMPAAETKQNSVVLKHIQPMSPALKKIGNKLIVDDKAKFNNTSSDSSNSPENLGNESRSSTPSELPDRVLPEKVMKKTHGKKNRKRISHDDLPSDDDLLLKYLQLQRIPRKGNETQVNNPEAGAQNIIGTTLHASRNPLTVIKENCNDSKQPTEDQLSIHRDHLHNFALTQGVLNPRTFILDFPKPLTENPYIRSDVSLVLQISANQSNQPEVPQSSPADKDHLQISPTQKIPGQSSAIPESSDMTNNPVDCSNSAEHQDSIIEEMDSDESSELNCFEQNVLDGGRTENEFSAVPRSLKNVNDSDQSADSFMEELLVGDIDTSSNVISTQNVDGNAQSNSPKVCLEEVLTASSRSNKPAGQSGDSILNKGDVWAEQLFNLFQKMKVDALQTCEIVHDMHKSLVQSYEVIEYIASASEKLQNLKKNKVAVATSEKATTAVQQVAEENEIKMTEVENADVNVNLRNNKEVKRSEEKDGDDDDDFDIDDSHNEDNVTSNDVIDEDNGNSRNVKDKDASKKKTPITTRGNIRTFVLPPEYDPDDTRWTLKYRKNYSKLNLVELVPKSNVFIDSIRLGYCKQVAKDAKALARMLLVEIFSREALSVCSLTGARANVFDITGTNVRPGLDEPARMAILSYVEDQALERGWCAYDSQGIINSLRSKIQEVRAKHGKTA